MRLYYDQLIGILLCWLLSFWIIRWYLWGIKIYPLNPSARKKRKKAKLSGSGFSIPDTGKRFLLSLIHI